MSPRGIAFGASFVAVLLIVFLVDRLLRPSLRRLLEEVTGLPSATDFYIRSFAIMVFFIAISTTIGNAHGDVKEGSRFAVHGIRLVSGRRSEGRVTRHLRSSLGVCSDDHNPGGVVSSQTAMSNERYLIVSYFVFAIVCLGLGIAVYSILRKPFEDIANTIAGKARQHRVEKGSDGHDDGGVNVGIPRIQLQPEGLCELRAGGQQSLLSG